MERTLVLVATLLVALGITSAFARAAGGDATPRTLRLDGGVGRVSPPGGATTDVLDWAVPTSYEYAPGLAGLPERVRALEGKAVVMRGFLLAISQVDDIHEFILVPNHASCCFGMPVGISGQVQVTLRKHERGLPNTNEPIEVRGTFRAVETKDQGILLSIFRLDDATAKVVGY